MIIAHENPGVETLRISVLKVFDGDGFLAKLRDERTHHEVEFAVRLGFIDAPEMGQPGGEEAKAALHALIGGRQLDLVILTKMDTGKTVDRHDRVVAVPYLRDSFWKPSRNIELEMILNGWAWVIEKYGPAEHYFDALHDAQFHKRGIWAHPENVPPWEFKRQRYAQRRQQRVRDTGQLSLAPVPTQCPSGCGGQLVQRNGKFGVFVGCSKFPSCRFSRAC